MDEWSKITISDEELSILTNAGPFLLHKRIKSIFTAQCNQIKNKIIGINQSKNICFPDYIDSKLGKLSQGMHYKDLPYFVFDFPRYFSDEKIFSFRLILVWSMGFSFHLIQKNHRHLFTNDEQLMDIIQDHGFNLLPEDLFWEHFSNPTIELSKDLLNSKAFKIEECHSIHQFNQFQILYIEFYRKVVSLLK